MWVDTQRSSSSVTHSLVIPLDGTKYQLRQASGQLRPAPASSGQLRPVHGAHSSSSLIVSSHHWSPRPRSSSSASSSLSLPPCSSSRSGTRLSINFPIVDIPMGRQDTVSPEEKASPFLSSLLNDLSKVFDAELAEMGDLIETLASPPDEHGDECPCLTPSSSCPTPKRTERVSQRRPTKYVSVDSAFDRPSAGYYQAWIEHYKNKENMTKGYDSFLLENESSYTGHAGRIVKSGSPDNCVSELKGSVLDIDISAIDIIDSDESTDIELEGYELDAESETVIESTYPEKAEVNQSSSMLMLLKQEIKQDKGNWEIPMMKACDSDYSLSTSGSSSSFLGSSVGVKRFENTPQHNATWEIFE